MEIIAKTIFRRLNLAIISHSSCSYFSKLEDLGVEPKLAVSLALQAPDPVVQPPLKNKL
jgi:hypothetical protein